MVFLDESGFSPAPYVARTWAPAGRTPVLVHGLRPWERLSTLSCVSMRLTYRRLKFNMYFRIRARTMRSSEVADYLRQLSRHVKGKAIVLMDNARQHKGKSVSKFFERYPRFEREDLPPYCPELDPDDGVWLWVKRDLANFCPRNVRELRKKVRGSMMKVQRRENLIEACLRQSELPCKDLPNQHDHL